MYYVYLLKSKNIKRTYVGYTKDLKKHLVEHNSGKVTSTKAYIPLVLVYYESYKEEFDARRREIELKNNSQKKEILFASLTKSLGFGDVV